jgi:hypothetical protein
MNIDPKLCAAVIDLAGCGLCALTVLWLLRSQGRSLEPGGAGGRALCFAGSMQAERHRQHVDEALAQVSGALEHARQRLGNLAVTTQDQRFSAAAAEAPPDGDAYAVAMQMAASGLPAATIAQRLDLPQAEIDLLVRLWAKPGPSAGFAGVEPAASGADQLRRAEPAR